MAPAPSKPTKPFHPTAPYYDQSTFTGRLRHMISMTDPRLLFTSKAELSRCSSLLAAHAAGDRRATAAELWRARTVLESCTHPTTGETIFPLFRMGAIAPMNIPIVAAMLQTPPTAVGATIFWHWFNQSYNTACNVANAGGEGSSKKELLVAYAIAVTASCSIAFAAGRVVASGANWAASLRPLIPFGSVAGANGANLFFSRSGELRNGTPVLDEDRQERGKSRIAGRLAVAQTALSRGCLVPAAAVLLPPASLWALSAAGILPPHPAAKQLALLSSIYLSVSAAVPAAIALFPQDMAFPAEDLEPEFQGLKRADGRPVRVLSANKGL